MKTEFDLRLAYKADTGVLPIRGKESSLRGDLNFGSSDYDLETEEDLDETDENEYPVSISAKEHNDKMMWQRNIIQAYIDNSLEDVQNYVHWIEERLLNLENNKSIKRRRTK